MKRLTPVILLSSGALALGLALAPATAAFATDITNPADNPYPITVVVDGQTYHDGLDTLPGYDDYACTVIPGVSYDFAHNKIDYPDGQVAPWTEWSRIPGYQVWLKQQSAPHSTPTPSPSPSSSPSSPSKSSGGKSSGSHRSKGSSGSTSAAATSTPATGRHKSDGSSEKSSTTTTADTTASSAPVVTTTSSGGTPVTVTASRSLKSTLTSTVSLGSGTSPAGLAVLAVLALGCLAVLGVHRFRRQFSRKTSI